MGDSNIPVETLHRLLILNEETGNLYWRVRSVDLFKASQRRTAESWAKQWNDKWAGKRAFTKRMKNGYLGGVVLSTCTYAHRVVFAMAYGHWPKGEVEHDNRVKDDNRPCNLLDVSKSQNQRNKPMQRNNTSGVMGVAWDKRHEKWIAYIKVSGNLLRLGSFTEKADAIAARRSAELQHGFHENHGKAA